MKSKLVMTGLVLSFLVGIAAPAFADHHHDEERAEIQAEQWQWAKHHHHHQAVVADWNQERNLYAHNWGHVNRAQQRELDAEMRAQWLAYHHNNWRGGYSWNNYNDPAFLDYLHNSNPSLLTRLRAAIGF